METQKGSKREVLHPLSFSDNAGEVWKYLVQRVWSMVYPVAQEIPSNFNITTEGQERNRDRDRRILKHPRDIIFYNCIKKFNK